MSNFSSIVQFVCSASNRIAFFVFFILAGCQEHSRIPDTRDPASFAVSSSLSSSHVTAFAEDASGQIWIGTDVGLNRYTGKEYYQYFRVEEPYALMNNHVRTFFTDSKGRFWIVTNGGACWYNEEDAFTRAEMDVTLRGAIALAESPSGDIIMYSYAGEMLVLDESDLTFHKVDFSISLPQCRTLFASPAGTVFLAADRALYEVDYHTGTVLQQIPWPVPDSRAVNYFTSDGNHRIYAYEDDLLCCYDLKQRAFVSPPAWMQALQEDGISLLYFKDERSFVLTNKGLCFHDGIRLYPADGVSPYYFADFVPTCMFLDSRDILWVGSQNKGFLSIPYGGTMFNKYQVWNNALEGIPVTSLSPDDGSGCWFISEGRLYHMNAKGETASVSPTGPSDTYQFVLTDTLRGTVWIARHWDVFSFQYVDGQVRNLRKYALSRRINSLTCASDGKVYAGTFYRGLFEVDPGTGRVRTLHEPEDDQLFGSAGTVYDLAVLKSGEVAVTMFQRDIEIYDPATGRVRILPYRNQIRELFNLDCLLEDRDGNIWFGTHDFGLYIIDTAGVCTMQDGLRSRAIRSLEQAPDGRIWVSTAHGLSMIEPEHGTVLNIIRHRTESAAMNSMRAVPVSCRTAPWFSAGSMASRPVIRSR